MNMEINEKEIEQSNRKVDLLGFKMQDELNPKIWDKEQKMKPDVRKTLLKIADDYFESLELPGVDIEDVTMTGSLANYNWSKYSDVDLHIVVDYKDIPVNEDLVMDFLNSKSSNWNKEHDVKIYGYDVELYVQDIKEEHHSTGIYSILKNEWVTKPQKKKISFNDKSVKDKSNRFMDRIEEIYDEMEESSNEETVNRVEKLTEKIKNMRKSGLESGGEFSVENIVFKVLRRNGMLDRLYDIKTVAYDKSVTLESININERLMDKIKNIKPKERIKKFLEGLKQENYETKEAYKLLVNSIKNKKKLSDEEKKIIKSQLGDLLKTAGFTVASILPGGIIYLLLTRVPSLKKYLTPSSFLDESKDFDWAKDIKEEDFWERDTYYVFSDDELDFEGPGILRSDSFEYEKSLPNSDAIIGEPTILHEFSLVYPGGIPWESISEILVSVTRKVKLGSKRVKDEYVYDKDKGKFV